MVPAHYEIWLTAAVRDADDMGRLWDRLHDAISSVPGVFSEGGSSELMKPGDLIEDSPLDRYIKKTTHEGERICDAPDCPEVATHKLAAHSTAHDGTDLEVYTCDAHSGVPAADGTVEWPVWYVAMLNRDDSLTPAEQRSVEDWSLWRSSLRPRDRSPECVENGCQIDYLEALTERAVTAEDRARLLDELLTRLRAAVGEVRAMLMADATREEMDRLLRWAMVGSPPRSTEPRV